MEMKIIVLSRNIITKKEHVLKQSSTTTWLSFSRSSVCNELNIRFFNYVQRSCRKKIKGISGNNNTSNRMLTGLVFFRRGKKEARFLELVAKQNLVCRIKSHGGESAEILIINITTYCTSGFEITFFGAIDSNIWSLFADELLLAKSSEFWVVITNDSRLWRFLEIWSTAALAWLLAALATAQDFFGAFCHDGLGQIGSGT